MVTEVGEGVSAAAVFHGGRIYPKWFVWRGRKIEVRETHAAWRVQDGLNARWYFSVFNGASRFELSFDPPHLSWTLEASDGDSP